MQALFPTTAQNSVQLLQKLEIKLMLHIPSQKLVASQPVMKFRVCSLLFLQKPATHLCPERYEASPQPHILFSLKKNHLMFIFQPLLKYLTWLSLQVSDLT